MFFRVVAVILYSAASLSAADINDVNELAAAARNGGDYTIAGGIYYLSQALEPNQNLVFLKNTTLVPVEGNVTIDCQYLHGVCFQDANYLIGDPCGTFRISFRKGYFDTAAIQAVNADVNAIFYYCDFSIANMRNGLTAGVGLGYSAKSVLNFCTSYSNHNDGFSLKNELGSGLTDKNVMILNSCKAYWNNDNATTAHDDGQVMIINGGEYYSNIHCHVYTGPDDTRGASLYLQNGAKTYNNYGWSIKMDQKANLFIDDASIISGSYVSETIMLTGTGVYVINSLNLDNNMKNCDGIRINNPFCSFTITNSIIKKANYYAQYGILVKSCMMGKISCCTFYQNYGHYASYSENLVLTNNIFSNASDRAIVNVGVPFYKNGQGNGWNLFYANSGGDFGYYGDDYKETDLAETNPQFVSPQTGDFRLRPTSPCIGAGKPYAVSGRPNIGAWQENDNSVVVPITCPEPLRMDFNGDCKVDFADFAIFSESWLDCGLQPETACW